MTIPLFRVNMSEHAKTMVGEVLDSGYVGQGPRVNEFEELLQEELGTEERPLAVSSATHGLDLCYHLLGLGKGDFVISTPMTCLATNTPLINRGVGILWADVDHITGNIDPTSVEKLLSTFDPLIDLPKAIVCVDWAGRLCDYESLRSYGIPVVQDAAHSWLASDFKAGQCGDYTVYSFQAIKHLTCGDGGAICVTYAQRARAELLRWYGLDRRHSEAMRCRQMIPEFGYKYHMNDIAAAIGIENIHIARCDVERRREIAKIYCKELKGIPGIEIPPYDPKCSYWLFNILCGHRDSLVEHLESYGIEASEVHTRNDMHPAVRRFRKPLPQLYKFSERQVSIPIGWWVTDSDIEMILNRIHQWKIPSGF